MNVDLLILFIKDIYKTFKTEDLCDFLDIVQIISFGLLVNGLYGFMKSINFFDGNILIFSTYAIIKARRYIKDKKC